MVKPLALLSILTPALALAQAPTYTEGPPPGPEMVQPLHLRFGFDGAVGYFTPGEALDFAASGRLGVQLNPILGLYADVGYVAGDGLGVSLSSSGASVSSSGVGFVHFGALAEGDFGPLYLAGGPMIASGGFGEVAESADSSGNVSQYAVAAGGVMPGFDLRAGLNFGGGTPDGRRSGFTLGVELLGLLARANSVGQSTSSSGATTQSIKVGDTVFGATPMLTLGFESW